MPDSGAAKGVFRASVLEVCHDRQGIEGISRRLRFLHA